MGPIQPLGNGRLDWLNRPSPVGDLSGAQGAGMPAAAQNSPLINGQSISMLGISSSVSQMLSSIGGGGQGNQMLEMMITLLILMSMLEQQRGCGGQVGSSLGKLGGAGGGFSSLSYSSTTISTQVTSLSYTQLQVTQLGSGSNPVGGANTPKFDTTV